MELIAPSLGDCPHEVLTRISDSLSIMDRMAFMQVSRKCHRSGNRWTEITGLHAYAVVELYSKDQLAHFAWGKTLLNTQLLSHLVNLRDLQLVSDCHELNANFLPSMKGVERMTLYHLFFTGNYEFIQEDVLLGLLQLPRLRYLKIKTLYFAPSSHRNVTCQINSSVLTNINSQLTSLHLEGITISRAQIAELAEKLPCVENFSVEEISDLHHCYIEFMETMKCFSRLKTLSVPARHSASLYDPRLHLRPEATQLTNNLECLHVEKADTRVSVRNVMALLPATVRCLFLGPGRRYVSNHAWTQMLSQWDHEPVVIVVPEQVSTTAVANPRNHYLLASNRLFECPLEQAYTQVKKMNIDPAVEPADM